jgi:multidrug efflux pump subunit AcrA (membrane-fusion protein)
VRFSYRIGSKYFAEFALIPSAALILVLFRSRLRSLRRVLTEAWQRIFASGFQWRATHVLAAVGLIALLFVPLWRDRENAFFVIEPAESHAICAAVPGRIDEVLVQEGQHVRAGQPLLRMTSFDADAMKSVAQAQTRSARFATFTAQMQGQSGGTAIADQVAARRLTRLANEAQSLLELSASTDGTVLTQNPSLLLDQKVGSGEPLLEVAEGAREARVFIPISAFNRISADSEVTLQLPGQFSVLRLKLTQPAGDPVSLPPGLLPAEKYQGFKIPVFYSARITLPPAAGNPMYGLSGQAKIFGERRCIAGRVAMTVSDLAKAHIW